MSSKKYRSDYRVSDFQIPNTKLYFQIFDGYTRVRSFLRVVRQNPDATDIVLDGENLEFISCRINGQDIDSSTLKFIDHTLTIPWIYDDECIIELENTIYPEKNTLLEGLYYASGFYCTQNEPMGFRHITYFLDRPDVMSIFETVRIEADKKYPLLLSNGNKRASGDLENNRHFVEWSDPFRKPTYLFALVCADLEEIHDTFTTMSDKIVDLYVYVDHGKWWDALWAMESLKRAMKWDEVRYGREYDLDVFHIVATDSFNMGAMENKSLNIFNTIYIRANPRTSTDKDFMDVEAVIGHEYFHNWTGNRITCRDWFQLTLKEWLTVFRDQNFSADMHSALTQRISDIEYLREIQFAEDQGKTSHPIQPDSYIEMNNFYTATVYDKWSEVIRMMESMVGRERFRKGMDLYFYRHDWQAVTTSDFVQAISDGAGIDLTGFEQTWYHQPRTPIVQVTWVYNQGESTYRLMCTQVPQSTPEGQEISSWYIPFFIAFFDPDNGNMITLDLIEKKGQSLLDQWALILRDQEEVFVFRNVPKAPKISLNRWYKAPIHIESSDIDLSFLSLSETDGISRYDAWKKYSIESLRIYIQKGTIDQKYRDMFAAIISENITDYLYTSLLITFPNVSTLLNDLAPINPLVLEEKRNTFLATIIQEPKIVSKLIEIAWKICDGTFSAGDTFTDADIQKRAYISSIVGLMSDFHMDTREIEQKLLQSSKMTLNLAAWKAWLHRDPENGIVALQKWMEENHFTSDLLMRMKYFSLIAQSGSKNLLSHLDREMSGPLFDITIPNLVRSLIWWVSRNFGFFHAVDGSGYRYYAENIKKIDAINPQIASRLSKSFTIYELVDVDTKKTMKGIIDDLLSFTDLSSGVREILEKIIA